jgi:thymidylate kinase
MGQSNYLIEGVSGTGKTTLCDALDARGYQAIHGDRVLACMGDPMTCRPVVEPEHASPADAAMWRHSHHIWDLSKVRHLAADRTMRATFFCGGARNHAHFLDLMDAAFILTVDVQTLTRRLSNRGSDEFGGHASERDIVLHLHATEVDMPESGVRIDATRPVAEVADAILGLCGLPPVCLPR